MNKIRRIHGLGRKGYTTKKTLNDRSRGKQLILFPDNHTVSREGAKENIEIRVSILDVMWSRSKQWERKLLGRNSQLYNDTVLWLLGSELSMWFRFEVERCLSVIVCKNEAVDKNNCPLNSTRQAKNESQNRCAGHLNIFPPPDGILKYLETFSLSYVRYKLFSLPELRVSPGNVPLQLRPWILWTTLQH